MKEQTPTEEVRPMYSARADRIEVGMPFVKQIRGAKSTEGSREPLRNHRENGKMVPGKTIYVRACKKQKNRSGTQTLSGVCDVNVLHLDMSPPPQGGWATSGRGAEAGAEERTNRKPDHPVLTKSTISRRSKTRLRMWSAGLDR